jgi:hypothetical protein
MRVEGPAVAAKQGVHSLVRFFVFSSVGAWGPFKMYITAAVCGLLVQPRLSPPPPPLPSPLHPLPLLLPPPRLRIVGSSSWKTSYCCCWCRRCCAARVRSSPALASNRACTRGTSAGLSLCPCPCPCPPTTVAGSGSARACRTCGWGSPHPTRHTTHATRWSRQVRIISKTSTARVEESK